MGLQELLGRKVDVVTEDSIYWLLKRRILKEAVPLDQLEREIAGESNNTLRDDFGPDGDEYQLTYKWLLSLVKEIITG